VRDRPQWRVLQGGSRRYVDALLKRFSGELRLATPVDRLQRGEDQVTVHAADGSAQAFDYVVLACHSDQSLALLDDPDNVEREVLGAIDYQPNEVVLHTDECLLPRRRRAWAAWNYRLGHERGLATLTYNMNILQGLATTVPLCVTLNDTARIDPARVLHRETLSHPQYTLEALRAQGRLHQLNGRRRSFYCGAYWGYGFHEDGVVSAMRAVADLEQCIDDQQLSLHGTRAASASYAGQ
jgi:predicted NAD/FAD-binding protein